MLIPALQSFQILNPPQPLHSPKTVNLSDSSWRQAPLDSVQPSPYKLADPAHVSLDRVPCTRLPGTTPRAGNRSRRAEEDVNVSSIVIIVSSARGSGPHP